MNIQTKGDTSSDNIDVENFTVQTSDGQHNGNESVNSDNTDIIDDVDKPTLSQEMPLSQMPRKNPYIKDDATDEALSGDTGSQDDGTGDSNLEATDSQVSDGTMSAEESEAYIGEEREEGEETDLNSRKED